MNLRSLHTQKIIKLILKYEYKRFFYKAVIVNVKLPEYARVKAYRFLSNMDRRTSLSYLQLRCFLTGRSKSLLSFFKLSRIAYRSQYSMGLLGGIRKSSS